MYMDLIYYMFSHLGVTSTREGGGLIELLHQFMQNTKPITKSINHLISVIQSIKSYQHIKISLLLSDPFLNQKTVSYKQNIPEILFQSFQIQSVLPCVHQLSLQKQQ